MKLLIPMGEKATGGAFVPGVEVVVPDVSVHGGRRCPTGFARACVPF